VQPRNMLLLACHGFNVTAQLNQMRRAIQYRVQNDPDSLQELEEVAKKAAAGGVALGALIAGSGKIQVALASEAMPSLVQKIAKHPAGPFYIHFWAPTFKWALSVANLLDLERPTDQISLAQMTALTSTGLIWSKYSMAITPKNYNLLVVNLALALSSSYHLSRKIKADYEWIFL